MQPLDVTLFFDLVGKAIVLVPIVVAVSAMVKGLLA